MINSLFLETEIESIAPRGSVRNDSITTQTGLKFGMDQQQDFMMKQRITDLISNASKFFWYPPKGLITERTIMEREHKAQSGEFPGYGIAYTQSSINSHCLQQRSLMHNKINSDTIRRSYRTIKSAKECQDFLKSGQLSQIFKIKICGMGNLIKALDDLNTGNNTVHEIHEYKYVDTAYEMKYGYDLIVDSVNAREELKRRK